MYIHIHGGAIDLMVTTQAILHSAIGHLNQNSALYNLTTRIIIMYAHPPRCAMNIVVTSKKISSFMAGHQTSPHI